MKKILSVFLIIAMILSALTVSAAHYTDINGHWAQQEIETWSEHGVISGYNGEFSPNRHITRGEFAVVLSRLMGYQKVSENTFYDLADKFYTEYILKLFEAGVMQGFDGSIRPEASLTREEAAVMVCKALGISTSNEMDREFSDESDISGWSKGYINAMVNRGLLNGADGKLNPKDPITRAEVVKILDNAVYPILKSGTFDKIKTGKILVISAGSVIITNSDIEGKTIITQGVISGKVSFKDTELKNEMVIDNDRSAFIETKNLKVSDKSTLTDKAFVTVATGGASGSSGGGGGSSGGSGGGGGAGGSGSSTTKYTVTFMVNGQSVGNVKVESGKKIGNKMPEVENIEGFIFKGWKNSETGEAVTEETVVTKSITVIADLEEIGDSGDEPMPDNPEEPEEPGGSGGNTTGGTSTGGSTTGGSTTGGATTEEPEETTCTVTFKLQGQIYSIIEVEMGTAIGEQLPEVPAVEGYTFKGWKDIATGEYVTAETIVNSSMTVNASLKRNTSGGGSGGSGAPTGYSVTFYVNGELSYRIGVFSGNQIGDRMPEEPVLEGFTFKGWQDLFAGTLVTSETVITGVTTVVALFESNGENGDCGEEHNWDEGVTIIYETCTDDGARTYTCTVCNVTKTEVVPASGHACGEWEFYNKTFHKRMCETCEVEFRERHMWDEGVIIAPATCTEDGEKAFSCSVCNGTKTEVIPATGHTYGEWVNEDDIYHKKECSCGDIVRGEHIWKRGLILEPEPISTFNTERDVICFSRFEVIPPDSWYEDEIPVGPSYPLLSDGDYICTVCYATKKYIPPTTISVGEAIFSVAAGGHARIPVKLKGNIDGLKQLTLNLTYDADVFSYVDASEGFELRGLKLTKPDSDFEEGNLTFSWSGTEADYTNGTILYVQFNVSDVALVGYYNFNVEVIDAYDSNMEEIEIVEEEEEIYVYHSINRHPFGEWEKYDENNHKKECSCGAVVIEPHIWDDGVVTKEPTVAEEGIFTYTCTVCGETKTESIKKLPDPATTTTITVGNANANAGEEITIPVSITNNNIGICAMTLNFQYDANVLTYVDATQGEALAGLDLTKPGSNHAEGDINFVWDSTDSDFTNGEILLITFKVANTAVGGEYDIDVITKDVCDFNLDDIETIVVSGTVNVVPHQHEYGEWESEDETNHKKACSCGNVVTEAHIWDTGVVEKEPTITEEGVMTYTCTVCNETKTESIKKLPDPATTTTIIVGDANANAGEEITIPVSITNNNIGICAMTLNFQYDANVLTYVDATQGEALAGLDLTKPGSNHAEGDINFVWDSTDSDFTNGEILLITFKVADTAVGGEYDIDVITKDVCDFNLDDIETIVVSGTVNVVPHQHEYGEWESKDETNHKKACSCGNVVTEAHAWDTGVVTKEPTHIDEGVTTYTCICGEKKEESIDKMPEHEYDNGIVTTPATHLAEGVMTYTCACGDSYTEAIEKTPDHEYGDWEMMDAENHQKECTCGDVVTEAHTMDDGVVTKEPTATEEGVMTYTCVTCDFIRTEIIEKLQTITVGNVRAKAGEEIKVPVTLMNNRGLTGMTLVYAYDSSALELIRFERGEALLSMTFTKPGNMSANPIKTLWDATDGDDSNGTVVYIIFKVLDTAESGEYPIDLTVDGACDSNVNDVEIVAIDGVVSISN